MKKILFIFLSTALLLTANISKAGDVTLFHDKAGWQDWWTETFAME